MTRGIAERIAQDLLRLIPSDPPIDLEILARERGASITYGRLVEDGRLYWQDGTPIIEVRSDRPRARQRFTVAHEIAHLMLAQDSGLSESKYRKWYEDEYEERLCDAIAAALLMPRPWMARYRDLNPGLHHVRHVANRAEVSLSAAAVRLSEVTGRLWALLRWKVQGSEWTLAGMAGVPSNRVGNVVLSPASLAKLSRPSPGDEWLNISAIWGNQPSKCRAHVSRSFESCLMLVTRL